MPRTLVAHPLPLSLDSFKLPVSAKAEILGLYETEGLFLWAMEDPAAAEGAETTFHVRRAGDPISDDFEFVTSGQRANGIVILLFREK
jgi:hypothetical protein